MRNPLRLNAKVALLVLFPLVNTPAVAQQLCTKDVAMATQGAWKQDGDTLGRIEPIEAAANVRIGQMSRLLRAAYAEPRGVSPTWYRRMRDRPLVTNGPTPYELDAAFFDYLCNMNRRPAALELGGETDIWFYVYANQFSWFFDAIEQELWTVDERPVYLLTKRVGRFQGYQLYEGIHNGRANTGVTHSHAPTGVRIFFWVRDVNALYEEVVSRGVAIEVPIETRPYRVRDFSIRDPNGVEVVLGQDWD